MVLSYYNKFDDFLTKNTNTINPRLCCLLLTPLLFIGNVDPILVVSIISLITILNHKKLSMFDDKDINSQKDEDLESSDEDEEEYSDEEEEEYSDEEEKDSSDEEEDEDEVQASDEEEVQVSDKEKDSDCLQRNCHLIILTVKNKTQKFILTNELITTYKSKLIELGSIKLDSTNINLIVLEIDVSEDDIEKIKQDNELYDYATFDDTLNILEDVKLECIWRRYKHILSENEYKDNTYTIL